MNVVPVMGPESRVARLRALRLALLLVLAVFMGRVFQIQVLQQDDYAAAVQRNSLRKITLVPDRGRLLDRNGEVLAANGELAIRTGRSERMLERLHPWGGLAAPVLGTVGREGEGRMGLERTLDRELRGLEGWQLVRVDARGQVYDGSAVERKDPVLGLDAVLTLDRRIQEMTEAALADGIQAVKGKSGAALVIDPRTGDILAMATWPSFDPDQPSTMTTLRLRNDPLAALHEPGSVMKAITAAAALEEGKIHPDDILDVSLGYYEVPGGSPIKDFHKMGKVTFADAMAFSSNVGFAKVSERLGAAALYQYLRRFGMGTPTGIDLSGEERGQVRPVYEWSGRSLPTLAMGHEMLATPLQVAMAYAAIANNGVLMRPRLIRSFRNPETGETVEEFAPQEVRKCVSPETATTLRTLMRQIDFAGKTGTAEKFDPLTKKYLHDRNTSSFVGFFPVDEPEYVIYAMVDEPETRTSGAQTAGPIFRTIAQRFHDMPGLVEGVALAGGSLEPQSANLLGKRWNEARKLCADRKLRCVEEGSGDWVMAQMPAEHAGLLAGDTLRLRRGVLDGQSLPDLRGQGLRQAMLLLEQRGWQVRWNGTGVVVDAQIVNNAVGEPVVCELTLGGA